MVRELAGEKVRVRQITPRDAPGMLRIFDENREFFRPWEPERPDDFYTLDRQRALIEREIADRRMGIREVFAIRDASDDIVGRIALNEIVRGVFQNAHLGYDIAEEVNGRGYATEAVHLVVDFAFRELTLHRVEAATMLANARSQRVLTRNGFRHEGTACGYLKIAGAWEDHLIYAITTDEWAPRSRRS